MCVGFWGPPPSAKLIIFLWTSLSGRGHLWRRLVPCSLSEQRDGCDLCCGVGFFFERELPFLEVMVKTSSSQPSMACKDRFIYIYIYIYSLCISWPIQPGNNGDFHCSMNSTLEEMLYFFGICAINYGD